MKLQKKDVNNKKNLQNFEKKQKKKKNEKIAKHVWKLNIIFKL